MQFFAKDLVTLNDALNAPPQDWEAEVSALAADSLRESGRLRLQVRGESMLPILWPGDVIEISKCGVEDVCPGEIVLARRGGRFFLHRFVSRGDPGGFRLRGDAMPAADPQFPNEALLGRFAGRLERKENRTENGELSPQTLPLSPWSWVAGQVLCHCGLIRRLALKLHSRKRNAGEARGFGDGEIIELGTVDPGAS